MSALILDCDGVIAETERNVHLPAFNQAFRELGVPVHWSDDEYAEKLHVAGGRERMATSLGLALVSTIGGPTDEDGLEELLPATPRPKDGDHRRRFSPHDRHRPVPACGASSRKPIAPDGSSRSHRRRPRKPCGSSSRALGCPAPMRWSSSPATSSRPRNRTRRSTSSRRRLSGEQRRHDRDRGFAERPPRRRRRRPRLRDHRERLHAR